MQWRRMILALTVLLLFCVGLTALLLAREGRFIYFPTRTYDATPEQYGLNVEALEIRCPDSILLRGWHVRGNGTTAVLYFHGNGGNISHRLERTKMLVENLGVDVFLVDYRGYGRSSGSAGEPGMYVDGEAIYEATRERGFPPDRIVLFGESLGGGVAVETALRRPVRSIILEAPFLSIPKMAKAIYPFLPSFVVRTKFDNEEKISRVQVPKLIAAAENDDVVPLAQTRRLFELAREPKRFFLIRGAEHNNIYIVGGREYLEVWRGFLK